MHAKGGFASRRQRRDAPRHLNLRGRPSAVAILALALLFGAFAGQAGASTLRVWTGAGGNGLWSNAKNWTGNAAPETGDSVEFNTPSSTTDDVSTAIGAVLFTSAAGGSTLAGAVNIDASVTTINIESASPGNTITAAVAFKNSTLYVQSKTVGQTLTMSGVISGAAGVRFYGPGAVELSGVSNNTYTGSTTVASNDANGGAGDLLLASTTSGAVIPGDLQIGGTAVGQPADSARVQLKVRDDIADSSNVTVAKDGLLDLNGLSETVGTIAGSGNITQGGGALTVVNGVTVSGGSITSTAGAPLILTSTGKVFASAEVITSPIQVNTAGPVTLPVSVGGGATLSLNSITTSGGGALSVTKSGEGTLEMSGASTYTGATNVGEGTLALGKGASLASSGVSVSAGAALRGLGSSGPVSVAEGALAPGLPSGAHGAYAIAGALTLTEPSRFDVDVEGAGSEGYDSVSATGPVTLGESALDITAAAGFHAPPHTRLRLIDDLGASPVGGTFKGLPEGAAVLVGSQSFKLTYEGGTGNDVELFLPNTAPLLAAAASAAPASGVAGSPIAFSVLAADPDEDALSYTWSFGDGTTGTGATATHTYAAPGQYLATVSITDGFGGSLSSSTGVAIQVGASTQTGQTATPTQTAPADASAQTAKAPAPALTGFSQTSTTWRPGRALAVFATRSTKRAPVGTTFGFTLDRPATVTLVFTQKVAGRRSGARCVAATPRNRSAKPCTRTVSVAAITHAGRGGKNTIAFQGRVSARKTLDPGRYTVTASAQALGLRSQASSLSFAIVK